MAIDPFTERLAKVRQRFVSTLESKIEDTYTALPALSGEGSAVAETYRRIHGIVGIGPTVGLAATGRAARGVENLLLPAYSAKRGLNAIEMDAVRKALHALREAAQRDIEMIAVL
jgi:chemotaxis protein histidine kinase CheA